MRSQPARPPESGRVPALLPPGRRKLQLGAHKLSTPHRATRSTRPRFNRSRRARRTQSCRLEYPTSPPTRWSRLGLPPGRHPRSGTDPRTRPANSNQRHGTSRAVEPMTERAGAHRAPQPPGPAIPTTLPRHRTSPPGNVERRNNVEKTTSTTLQAVPLRSSLQPARHGRG